MNDPKAVAAAIGQLSGRSSSMLIGRFAIAAVDAGELVDDLRIHGSTVRRSSKADRFPHAVRKPKIELVRISARNPANHKNLRHSSALPLTLVVQNFHCRKPENVVSRYHGGWGWILMARPDTQSAKQDQFNLRFPEGMRDNLRREAERNGRSMNAEIVSRLEDSFPVRQALLDLVEADKAVTPDMKQMIERTGILRKIEESARTIEQLSAELREMDTLDANMKWYRSIQKPKQEGEG